MEQVVNPDEVCRRVVQARLELYQGKEVWEATLKSYNDQVQSLLSLVGLMKARILELEAEVKRARGGSGETPTPHSDE